MWFKWLIRNIPYHPFYRMVFNIFSFIHCWNISGSIMQQQPLRLIMPQAHHTDDPETSVIAAKKADIKGQALEVLKALKKYPRRTAYELANAIKNDPDFKLDYYKIQRRLSVLKVNRLAKTVGERQNPVTGLNNQVWEAV